MGDRRYEDDRPRRRGWSGLSLGGLGGAVLGTAAGAVALGAAAMGSLLGMLAGGALGHWLAAHVSLEDWDPTMTARPYVGVHAPDSDAG